jgi:carboxyl-terminal processing protease
MKRFVRALAYWASSLTLAAQLAPAAAQTPVTVVEYYNSTVAAYFLTGRANEQALLDSISDFRRTGMTFAAVTAQGSAAPLLPVCRYRIGLTPSGFSSHFYGLPADCQLVASFNNPAFFGEGLDFAVQQPNAGGVCPAAAPIAVYRSLRRNTPVDIPNHRYTVSRASYDTMVRRGWSAEGAVFCVTSATDETPRPTFAASSTLQNKCAAPRVGVSPVTGQAYPDTQATMSDEKLFLRSFTDETYLWYREIEQRDPANYSTALNYFPTLKTFAKSNSLKPDGTARAKDEFHFTQATAAAESSSAGIELSYGIDWEPIRNTAPRNWVVSVVTPNSPAALAGVKRGDKLLQINGLDFVNGTNTTSFNAALFPSVVGTFTSFALQPADGSFTRNVALEAQSLQTQSVPISSIINTPTGRVGYFALTTFNAFTVEQDIINAITGLRNGGVTDLVVDMRYNGGGYIYISSQLAYMVAGASKSAGKVYSGLRPNDKDTSDDYPFYNITSGRGGTVANQPLPTLNLNRVYVLTGSGSCSATESFINGLKGIDVDVILVGETSCGKPYGFSREDNCGNSFYTIQFTSVNQKGEGDYINGFAPRCVVADDLTKDLGSPQEKRLAAALSYRNTGVCPAVTSTSQKRASLALETGPLADAVRARSALRSMALKTPSTRVVGSAARTVSAPVPLTPTEYFVE